VSFGKFSFSWSSTDWILHLHIFVALANITKLGWKSDSPDLLMISGITTMFIDSLTEYVGINIFINLRLSLVSNYYMDHNNMV
jgi:hypothetical protein